MLNLLEQNWLQQLANAISSPEELLKQLEINASDWQNDLKQTTFCAACAAKFC